MTVAIGLSPGIGMSPALMLFLATVVVEFVPTSADGRLVGFRAGSVRDAFMDNPDVVTVRPEGDEHCWLYRVDLESRSPTPSTAPALRPALRIAGDFGWHLRVVRVGLMSKAEREVFHARFSRPPNPSASLDAH